MKVFEVCLTNYCNFKCDYCISDKTRGLDKFSEPLKLDENGYLLLHDKDLSADEKNKRAKMLEDHGQAYLDAYVQSEHDNWMTNRHLKHDYTDWLNFDHLISFVRENLHDNWIINLTGGEPLYYPKIEYLIGKLVETNIVLITTNASLIRSKPELLKMPRNKLFFRIGYHPEFRNLDTFKKCMEYVIDHNFQYVINYVAHPKYYENESNEYKKHLDLLIDNQYQYEITPFEGKYNGRSYPSGRYGRSAIEEELFGSTDKHRQIHSPMGTSFLMCEPNGEIFECQGKNELLGDVYENRINFKKVQHSLCFSYKGCHTSKSANTYLTTFFGSKLG